MPMQPHWSIAQKAEYCFAQCLGYLPVDITSDIGVFLGKRQASKSIRAKRLWIDRLRNNLHHLCGIDDPYEREQRLVAFIGRIGRLYAEYMILHKIVRQGRLEIVGQDILNAIDKPVIITSCHLSNWELVGHLITCLQRPCVDLYLTPESPVKEQLALAARQQWSSTLEHIPASTHCLRPINKALSKGSNFLIFVDEMSDGYVVAPNLGRTIDYAGNRWFAARLAVKHNIDILPAYVLPNGKGHYKAVVEPMIQPSKLQGSEVAKARIIADQLDDLFNQCISKNLEHWYWLPYYEQNKSSPRAKGEL